MWRTLQTRRAGARGTKKLVDKYGERLLCVRYRYDAETRERIKTVELMVERMGERKRRQPDGAEVVYVNVAKWEPLLRRAVLQGGGRWDDGSGLWRIARATAESLGLLSRIVRRRGTTAGAPRKNHR